MAFRIFYSWQVKLETKYNRNFIENALKDSVKQLKRELKADGEDFYLDRDTKDVPGLPNIPTTLQGKISVCDAFIGDVSFVSYVLGDRIANIPNPARTFKDRLFGKNKTIQQTVRDVKKEGVYSNNVGQELGIAMGSHRGSERVIIVMNTAYGKPEDLNFDLKQYRYPILYHLDETATDQEKQKEKTNLIAKFKDALRLIFDTEHERQKEYVAPFITWKSWDKLIKRQFPFEVTEYIKEIYSSINENINTPKAIYRLCGLSGIGKTRMLFEFFIHTQGQKETNAANKLLYVDVNEQEEKRVLSTIKELVQKNEEKILIVDNCSKDFHISITSLVTAEKSRLSAITVSIDPEEKASDLDSERLTRLLILDNQKCKQTVDQILISNFPEFQEAELKLLVDFSSGIAFVATLMAGNTERGKYQPGTLTRIDLIERLLGPVYTNKNSRAAVNACSLFSKFGFFDDLAFQSDKIALNTDIFEISSNGVRDEDLTEWRKLQFKTICEDLYKRQLLEKRGRTYSFRPSPLAVRMAEDWWANCTMTKFERVITFLKDADLVESFCEQFQYLRHVENAQTIVRNLCDSFFSSAEVLNTSVGSRLFRSFVYVNPIACSKALATAFLPLSPDNLRDIKDGRRNLIWALEKLCFRPETFHESTKVMAAFAMAENENIGNNATNQFLQLFHIYLAGTAVNLDERWSIIQFYLDGDIDFQSIAYKALKSAISVGHFSRFGNAEDQGDVIPLKDYHPTNKEIYEYWKKAITILEHGAISPNLFQEKSLAILNDSFYGLCVYGAGNLIIPVMANLLKAGLVDRMALRASFEFALNSNRVNDTDTIDKLSQLMEDLSPNGFVEKFRIFVIHPSLDEYVEKNNTIGRGVKLQQKIEHLTEEYLQDPQKGEYLNLFTRGKIAEGFNFGKFLSQKANPNELEEIVTKLIGKLKSTPSEIRNVSILTGMLVNYKNQRFTLKTFHQLLNEPDLSYIAFDFARLAALSKNDFLLLIDVAKKEGLPSEYFKVFMYGWGLRHLSVEEVVEILQGIRGIGKTGKVVAFMILSTWIGDDVQMFEDFRDLVRNIILIDSKLVLENLVNSMDVHYFVEMLSKLLNDKNDDEIASLVITTIIEQSNEAENYYSKEHGFINLLNILYNQYFLIFWEKIASVYNSTEKYGLAAFHLRDLLGSKHSYEHESAGLLFSGDSEKFESIFNWCKKNRTNGLYFIAELLPQFDGGRNNESDWHPYTKKFIDEFGDDINFLRVLGANINTFSWMGPVADKLKADKALFEKLEIHPLTRVREWAKSNIEDLNKRIKWESDRDEDGIILGYSLQ